MTVLFLIEKESSKLLHGFKEYFFLLRKVTYLAVL